MGVGAVYIIPGLGAVRELTDRPLACRLNAKYLIIASGQVNITDSKLRVLRDKFPVSSGRNSVIKPTNNIPVLISKTIVVIIPPKTATGFPAHRPNPSAFS